MTQIPQILISSWKEFKILYKLCIKNDCAHEVIISDINFSYNIVPIVHEDSFTLDRLMSLISTIVDNSEDSFNYELAKEQLNHISDARYEHDSYCYENITVNQKFEFIIEKIKDKECFSSILPLTIKSIYNLWVSNILLLIKYGDQENDDFGFAAIASISSDYIIHKYWEKFCGNCSNNTCKLKCSKCNKQKYCNKECQKSHWKIHKESCIDLLD
jgi:hypothetical protein